MSPSAPPPALPQPIGCRRCAAGAALVLSAALAGCGANTSDSNVPTQGARTEPVTRALEVGAHVLQHKPPIEAINSYLDGFHFYSGHPQGQMEAHHYCSQLSEELIQCAIYDGNVRDAKLMGVEYIVSERLFNSLPEAEKTLWHSHVHEVKSGQLIAPGLPDAAEHALMKRLVGTCGKTFHTWHTDRQDALPLGVPQLMMGFTADGQLDPGLLAERDRRMGVDSAGKRAQRADIVAPPIAPGADAWQHGKVIQITDPTGHLPHAAAHAPGGASAAPGVGAAPPAAPGASGAAPASTPAASGDLRP